MCNVEINVIRRKINHIMDELKLVLHPQTISLVATQQIISE